MKTVTVTMAAALLLAACQSHEYSVCVQQCDDVNRCVLEPAGEEPEDCDVVCVDRAEATARANTEWRDIGATTGCVEEAEHMITCRDSGSRCTGPAPGCEDPSIMFGQCVSAWCTANGGRLAADFCP